MSNDKFGTLCKESVSSSHSQVKDRRMQLMTCAEIWILGHGCCVYIAEPVVIFGDGKFCYKEEISSRNER